jgi:hypothetical protein
MSELHGAADVPPHTATITNDHREINSGGPAKPAEVGLHAEYINSIKPPLKAGDPPAANFVDLPLEAQTGHASSPPPGSSPRVTFDQRQDLQLIEGLGLTAAGAIGLGITAAMLL